MFIVFINVGRFNCVVKANQLHLLATKQIAQYGNAILSLPIMHCNRMMEPENVAIAANHMVSKASIFHFISLLST